MIKYPLYTREQSLSCKLTNKDIEFIKYLYSQGLSYRKLGKIFNVSDKAIQYWINEKYRQKLNSRKRKRYYHYEVSRRFWKRKTKVFPKEFRAWENFINKQGDFYKSENRKIYNKKWQRHHPYSMHLYYKKYLHNLKKDFPYYSVAKKIGFSIKDIKGNKILQQFLIAERELRKEVRKNGRERECN